MKLLINGVDVFRYPTNDLDLFTLEAKSFLCRPGTQKDLAVNNVNTVNLLSAHIKRNNYNFKTCTVFRTGTNLDATFQILN